MKVAILGTGVVGKTLASAFTTLGHEVKIGSRSAKDDVVTYADAAGWGELVVISTLGVAVEEVAKACGASLDGKIVIDTTNQFGSVSVPADGETAAQHNAARMPGARYTKSFNTLTSAFQAEVAGRPEDDRVVQWVCGDDEEAKRTVMGLIADAGYAPVDVGGTADAAVMEMPRRPGAVYGEEYRLPDAAKVVEAVRAGEEIPPTPAYS